MQDDEMAHPGPLLHYLPHYTYLPTHTYRLTVTVAKSMAKRISSVTRKLPFTVYVCVCVCMYGNANNTHYRPYAPINLHWPSSILLPVPDYRTKLVRPSSSPAAASECSLSSTFSLICACVFIIFVSLHYRPPKP